MESILDYVKRTVKVDNPSRYATTEGEYQQTPVIHAEMAELLLRYRPDVVTKQTGDKWSDILFLGPDRKVEVVVDGDTYCLLADNRVGTDRRSLKDYFADLAR